MRTVTAAKRRRSSRWGCGGGRGRGDGIQPAAAAAAAAAAVVAAILRLVLLALVARTAAAAAAAATTTTITTTKTTRDAATARALLPDRRDSDDDETQQRRRQQPSAPSVQRRQRQAPRRRRRRRLRRLRTATAATGREYDELRIVGGAPVSDPHGYPWFVRGENCGGALIAPDVVLTAAHCVPDAFAARGTVRVGGVLKHRGGRVARIERTISHPDYDNRTQDYDYALVRITPTEPGTPTVRINADPAVPSPSGQEGLRVVGYGGIYGNVGWWDNYYPNRLHQVDVDALDDGDCAAAYSTPTQTLIHRDTMFCAGAPGKDACDGDSGGPLFVPPNDDGSSTTPTVVGVVSWGPTLCALETKPGVYARVSAAASWINETMCSLTGSDVCGGTGTGNNPYSDGKIMAVRVVVRYDRFPKQTAWGIYSFSQERVVVKKKFGHYKQPNGKHSYRINLQQGAKYRLFLKDKGGDGFCCDHGKGKVRIVPDDKRNGKVVSWEVRTRGRFQRGKSVYFQTPTL